MKTRFIFNPRSGSNAKKPGRIVSLQAFVAKNKLEATVVSTEKSRHATELARRAIDDGCQLIVAVGGDGTMNEVASAIVGTEAIFGLIPCGSGDGLGRHLGVHGRENHALETLLHGTVRTIDSGVANGFPFFNAMGVGFDAEISHRFSTLASRGLPAYCRTTLSAYFGFRPEKYVIHDGRNRLELTAFLVAVANSDQYGNNCYIAPGALVDDGFLDLTALKPLNLFNALPVAMRLFNRSIDHSASALRLRSDHFIIERSKPGLLHIDGEAHQTESAIDITVRPKSLRIMVPAPAQPA